MEGVVAIICSMESSSGLNMVPSIIELTVKVILLKRFSNVSMGSMKKPNGFSRLLLPLRMKLAVFQ